MSASSNWWPINNWRPLGSILLSWATLVGLTANIASVQGDDQLDWPTHLANPHRNAVTGMELDVDQLAELWRWRSPLSPQPAWSGPAKWDAYAGIRDLKSMRNYDPVFYPIVVEDRLFIGSSVEDAIHCFRLTDGQRLWSFHADGPIRVAPSFHNHRLYFGSDDGHAYCIDAAEGDLVWKFSPRYSERQGQTEPKIVHNGRYVSSWPVRTGVCVVDGIAYFASSLLPWEVSYLCAVDALTGTTDSPGTYVRELHGQTLEGALLVSPERLIFPQGRVPPTLFQRSNGESLGSLGGGGGSFVVLTRDSTILHGPGNKTGWITASDEKTQETVATFRQGIAMVVDDQMSFMLTDSKLIASDFVDRSLAWQLPVDARYALIKTANHLFIGGDDYVAAIEAESGEEVWRTTVQGRAYGIVAAQDRLIVSTDEGIIHVFGAAPTEAETSSDQSEQRQVETDVDVADGDAHTSEAEMASSAEDAVRIDDDRLVARWVFHEQYVKDRQIAPQNGNAVITLDGPIAFDPIPPREALKISENNTLMVEADPAGDSMPQEQLSVESWVRIDAGQTWGGIIGAIQDNGSFERGWLLGYRERRFCFAIVSEDGPGRLTYLTAPLDFELEQWYHVAGVYDGQQMTLYVNGEAIAQSSEQEGPISFADRAFFEIGAYHDDDENFPMRGQIHEIRIYDRALHETAVAEHAAEKQLGRRARRELAAGPWIEFVDPETALVRWETEFPEPTLLALKLDRHEKMFAREGTRQSHEMLITDLRRDRIYEFEIELLPDRDDESGAIRTRVYECDTYFNYATPEWDALPLETAISDRWKQMVDAMLADAPRRGLGVVFHSGDGELISMLAESTQLHWVGLEADPQTLSTVREQLTQQRRYGSQLSLHPLSQSGSLPLMGETANLVVWLDEADDSDGEWTNIAEALTLCAPGRGKLIVVSNADDFEFDRWSPIEIGGESVEPSIHPIHDDDGATLVGYQVVYARPRLPGAGEWSHLYGMPDNSAFGGESLSEAAGIDDLTVQWIGRPGARYQSDRSGRKPSPLSSNGRLYLQGLERLIALDAFNGTILWSREIPGIGRYNMPRDCSNWCVDDQHVYLLDGERCLLFDGETGEMVTQLHASSPLHGRWSQDWGFVAHTPDGLIGSSVKTGTSFTNFWGNADQGWYDARSGEATAKVCSDTLFLIRDGQSETAWRYDSGLVLNATITVTDRSVVFVESRNGDAIASDRRRFDSPEIWKDQYLVSIDRSTGVKQWEKPLNVEPGGIVFYLAASHDQLVLVSSNRNRYFAYGFSTDDGTSNWSVDFPWLSDNHGGHMSRPAIVGGKVYVRPSVLDLATGRLLDERLPGGGCGTYACTTDALFFRSGNVTVWDADEGTATSWQRLRPDCWLSTIPANGLLLSPEGGGGCSCGSWMEMSLAFKPKALLQPSRIEKNSE